MKSLIKREDLLPACSPQLAKLKFVTPVQALQAPTRILSAVIREEGEKDYDLALVKIVKELFDSRFSKQEISPVMVDEFGKWLASEYWFYKLQEVRLALLDYRGETFHVIDLEVLKTMVEVYDMKRAQASLEIKDQEEEPEDLAEYEKKELDRLTGYKRYPMPQETKALLNKMLVRSNMEKRLQPKPRPKSLEDLFTSQGLGDPGGTANRIREQWSEEWKDLQEQSEEIRKAMIKDKIPKSKIPKPIEPLKVYLQKKESYLIFSQTRAIPLR